MNKSVKVTANEAGQVVNVSKNNPDFGYIRVEQEKASFDANGWARLRKVSALIPGSVADLKSFGWIAGQSLAGHIVTVESLEPFNTQNPEKDVKVAGETGIICTVGGNPIYRRSFYTEDMSRTDVTIPHDNIEEIKAAYAELETSEEGSDADLNLG